MCQLIWGKLFCIVASHPQKPTLPIVQCHFILDNYNGKEDALGLTGNESNHRLMGRSLKANTQNGPPPGRVYGFPLKPDAKFWLVVVINGSREFCFTRWRVNMVICFCGLPHLQMIALIPSWVECVFFPIVTVKDEIVLKAGWCGFLRLASNYVKEYWHILKIKLTQRSSVQEN